MKNAFLLILCGLSASAMVSCHYVAGSNENATDSSAAYMPERVSRDLSINASNAVNHSFMDSMQMERYLDSAQLDGVSRQEIRNFYNQRNFQYAWFDQSQPTMQLNDFWNRLQEKQALDTLSQKQRQGIDSLFMPEPLPGKDSAGTSGLSTLDSARITADTTGINDSSLVRRELWLTSLFVKESRSSKDSNGIALRDLIPVRRLTVETYADSVLHRQADSNYLKQHKPQYLALLDHLRQLRAGNDTINVAQAGFDTASHARRADSTRDSSRMGIDEKMKIVLVNLDRLAWMPVLDQQKYVWVNIPSFQLTAHDSGGSSFIMPIAVGKEGTTVSFSDKISEVVVNPYWNLPASIVKNEVQPAIKNNARYLVQHHMEVYGQSDGLPQIRQLPGRDNALGQFKFVFPNTYDIYLHDTPDKSVFQSANRAVSHGCIRVADARKLAQFILAGSSSDSTALNKMLTNEKDKHIKPQEPVPVRITYLTVYPDELGKIHYVPDVYHHDAEEANRLFMTGG